MTATAREILFEKISALEEQKRVFTADLEGTDQKTAKYDALMAEINNVNEKLEKAHKDLSELDGAGLAAQAEIFSQFEEIKVDEEITLSLRELTAGEQQYQLLSMWFQQKFSEQAERHAAEKVALRQSFESELETLKDEVKEESKFREMYLVELDRAADLQMKLDNAAGRTLEAEEEVNRLEAELNKLRDQLEKSSQPTVTNLNTDFTALAREIHAKKPAIYNKRWEHEIRRTHYIAKLATTDEEIRIPHLEIGKYREIDESEVPSFRSQAEQVEEGTQENTSLVVDAPIFAFPTPPEDTADIVDQGNISLEVAEQEVSRAEFEALVKRVEALEKVEVTA